MDSGNESESSSIKLRKYAKKARIGTLKMEDGSVRDVPTRDEINDQILKVAKHLATMERGLNVFGKSALRRGSK